MISGCLVLLNLQDTNVVPVNQSQSRGASFTLKTQSVLYHTAERLHVRDLARNGEDVSCNNSSSMFFSGT